MGLRTVNKPLRYTMITLTVIIIVLPGIYTLATVISNYISSIEPVESKSYYTSKIQESNCVKAEYWICDLMIDGELVLGYRTTVELSAGDEMLLVKRGDRTHVFPK